MWQMSISWLMDIIVPLVAVPKIKKDNRTNTIIDGLTFWKLISVEIVVHSLSYPHQKDHESTAIQVLERGKITGILGLTDDVMLKSDSPTDPGAAVEGIETDNASFVVHDWKEVRECSKCSGDKEVAS